MAAATKDAITAARRLETLGPSGHFNAASRALPLSPHDVLCAAVPAFHDRRGARTAVARDACRDRRGCVVGRGYSSARGVSAPGVAGLLARSNENACGDRRDIVGGSNVLRPHAGRLSSNASPIDAWRAATAGYATYSLLSASNSLESP